jgi:hypothetical protein
LALANQAANGELGSEVYLLPIRAGDELPELPPGGLARLSGVARMKGARVINGPTGIALGRSPDIYAYVREMVHRNLYRIPLP